MYLRFQTLATDPDSGRPKGIFVAAAKLRDSNEISMEDEAWLRDSLGYFNEHLKVPACLKDWKNRRALSWFRGESSMIGKLWNLVSFMEEQDLLIEVVTSRDPGTIIYEDGHQVVAFPRK